MMPERRLAEVTRKLASVVKVTPHSGNKAHGPASGFFYKAGSRIFLITNRHVVIEESKDFFPDRVSLRLHVDAHDLTKNIDHDISVSSDGSRLWREHPEHGKRVDVVAIEVSKDSLPNSLFYDPFSRADMAPSDLLLPLGDALLVLGYPLGFHDVAHNLPIARSAMVASAYPIPFEQEPCFLVDARLHAGTSGSPVITRPTQVLPVRGGGFGFTEKVQTFLVGIHSASAPHVELESGDPIGLSRVWFSRLIDEIIG